MKAFRVTLLMAIFCSFLLSGGSKKGEISSQLLERLEKSVLEDSDLKAIRNAVSNNNIKDLVLNRDVLNSIDKHFAYRIETGGITDQKSSGRCWLFASLNVLRPRVLKNLNVEDFEFSQNYLFFYDLLEKSNLFLEAVIETRKEEPDSRKVEWLFKHPIQDGGVWSMAVDLIKKYGVVPKEVFGESYNSENTSTMRRLLARKLREDGIRLRELSRKGYSIRKLRSEKEKMLEDVYRLLVIFLGQPPHKFGWRYEDKEGNLHPLREYTPQRFYKEVVGVNLDDYVMLMDDPSKEYYRLYEIEYDRDLWEGRNWKFVNVPSSELKVYAKKSILSDEPLYFSCDVGKQLYRKEGLLALGLYDYSSLLGVEFGMDKRRRILTFDSGSTHGMSLVGIDTTADGKITKWLLENSWGSDDGFQGYLIMTDRWFDEYMFRIVIHKRFLPERIVKVWQSKPILLPPWDPMF
ncbi:MAG TPA: aminopeptidase [Candidatus Marinimicrobia bacterium]|nr:aminopeptidase [Candidatus Neomarinimicrobiota bacterium]